MKEKTKIKAEIVADSLDPRGNRLTSVLVVMPRIIIAEMNTHRMLSKNTSSSRAIPFKKMVEAVQENPFIPIAWQKEHKGMQGSEYFTDPNDIETLHNFHLLARDNAVYVATMQNKLGVTKQLCNRLLEPFMWTTMLITGSKEGWQNFFELRCPVYEYTDHHGQTFQFKSRKECQRFAIAKTNLKEDEGGIRTEICNADLTDNLFWLKINKGQAEIHLMDLAEKIYDAINESAPKQLEAGEWHIPFEDKINYYNDGKPLNIEKITSAFKTIFRKDVPIEVKISTAMAARTSYTVVGDEKEIDYEKMIKLHDKLIEMRHDSPLEHCARAMSDEEYYSFIKGNFNQEIEIDVDGFIDISTHSNNSNSFGWCRNFKGFIQYRHLIEEGNLL